MKNTNPGGNTLITEVRETTAEANGEFERFEALTSSVVRAPKQDVDKQRERCA